MVENIYVFIFSLKLKLIHRQVVLTPANVVVTFEKQVFSDSIVKDSVQST